MSLGIAPVSTEKFDNWLVTGLHGFGGKEYVATWSAVVVSGPELSEERVVESPNFW